MIKFKGNLLNLPIYSFAQLRIDSKPMQVVILPLLLIPDRFYALESITAKR